MLMSNDGCFWPSDVLAGEVIYPPGGRFGPRDQLNLQLVMLHSGRLTVWIDGIARHAPANSVFALFPGHEEYFEFASECETWHTWLHAYMPQLDTDLLARLQKLQWPLPLSSTMHGLIRDALLVQSTPFPTSTMLLKSLALQMIWRYIGEGELLVSQEAIPEHPAIVQAQQFMQAHLGQPLTLDTIANAVAMSPAHLIRLFQAQVHTTPMAYLWQRRVTKGVELLEQTGLTVGTIAERCGFQSRFHFSRRVREAVGATPLEVRRRSWRRSNP